MRLTIDQKSVEVLEGQTILQAARTAGIEIPTLCYLEGISIRECLMLSRLS